MCCVLNLNTVTLWAMWEQTIPTTMQGFGDYCKNMVQDNGSNGNSISITLRDTRDNNTYTVAKLKDGKCWMTQNLRIHGTTINYVDSDMSSGSFYVVNTAPISNFTTQANDNTNFVYYYNDIYGSYYTFYSSTAGSTISSGDAPNSVCPKGWKLPNRAEIVNISNNYNASTIQNVPANFILAGYIRGGTFQQLNQHGNYRAASNNKSSDAYYFHLSSGTPSLNTGPGGNCHASGCPVRCIAR